MEEVGLASSWPRCLGPEGKEPIFGASSQGVEAGTGPFATETGHVFMKTEIASGDFQVIESRDVPKVSCRFESA